jgi:hypothetical protein
MRMRSWCHARTFVTRVRDGSAEWVNVKRGRCRRRVGAGEEGKLDARPLALPSDGG